MLERDAEFAAAQRWRFRHLFVDEFQDASAAQFRLLRAWLGDRSDLCVVGDPDQAIYGFAGADASYLAGFRRVFPAEQFPDVGVVQLGSNYRSTRRWSRRRARCSDRPGDAVRAVHAARPDGPLPTFTEYDSADDEARGVARARCATPRARSSRGRAWRCSTASTRSRPCSRRRSRAPASRSACAAASGSSNARRCRSRSTRCAAGAREAPQRPFAEHLTDIATDAESLAEERREHVDALVRLGHEYLEADGGRGSVDGFLEFLQTSLRGDDAGNSSGNAVELLTFHRAKGLEFDTVFVTGLERGLVPISHAKTPEAMDEEQRLLYVALSRAERGAAPHLGARAHGGRTRRPGARAAAGSSASKTPSTRPRPARASGDDSAATASPTPATASHARRAGARAPRTPSTSPTPTRRSTRRWSTGACASRAPRARRRT